MLTLWEKKSIRVIIFRFKEIHTIRSGLYSHRNIMVHTYAPSQQLPLSHLSFELEHIFELSLSLTHTHCHYCPLNNVYIYDISLPYKTRLQFNCLKPVLKPLPKQGWNGSIQLLYPLHTASIYIIWKLYV